MYTECSQFTGIIKNVESVRSPHMFLLSTLYPTFYCGSGRTKVRPFLFFMRISRTDRKRAFCLRGTTGRWRTRSARPYGVSTADRHGRPAGRRCARGSRAEMRPTRPPCGQEGVLPPLLSITPAVGCSRVAATANKFVHILWKNLICDNVAAVQLCAWPGRRGCCRCKACACCLHEGDAPAGCRYAGAHVVRQHTEEDGCNLARVLCWRALRALLGWQPTFAYPLGRPGGDAKAPLTFTREARPEGNGVDWQEGENRRCSPSCPQRGRAGHIPAS